jgi:mannose-6-phosphate isomerase-like protein (cupin superfamily)
MKRIVPVVLAALLISALVFAQGQQQPQQQGQRQGQQGQQVQQGPPFPFRQLDPRQFDPKVDPDVDMFINHWSNSSPRVMYGNLVFRDILTPLQGPDPVHPTRKGAVLIYNNSISYATLESGASATGRAEKGSQQVFYVTGGAGTITVGTKSQPIQRGSGFIFTPAFDVALKSTGADQLTCYVLTERLAADFKYNQELVVTNRFDGERRVGAHWYHINNPIINSSKGMANYGGLSLIELDARTIPQAHSHGEGVEEVWIQVEGETTLLLGKQLRRCPAGTVYKIPPTGITAHTNINFSNQPVEMIHMMKGGGGGQAVDFANLDPERPNPATDPDIDMFMGNWRDSMPRTMHGNMVFRDMLTTLQGPDRLHPTRKGAVLESSTAVSHATLEPGASAWNVEKQLEGVQQVFVVDSGAGTITSGNKTSALTKDVSFIITPGLNFRIASSGKEYLTFYVVTEKLPQGFTPNKELVVVDNRGEAPFMRVHWAHIDRPLINSRNGMSQYGAFTEVKLDAMTMSQPHSHDPNVEEIWIATDGEIELFLGKQLRKLPVGTAYRIPSTGRTAHANINVSDGMIKLIHMMKTAPTPSPAATPAAPKK